MWMEMIWFGSLLSRKSPLFRPGRSPEVDGQTIRLITIHSRLQTDSQRTVDVTQSVTDFGKSKLQNGTSILFLVGSQEEGNSRGGQEEIIAIQFIY